MTKQLSTKFLEQISSDIDRTLDEASQWLEVQHVMSDAGKSSISKFLLNAERHNRELGEAINQRPAIGIFGASQVGKSYLVSNLAKPGDSGSLNIMIPGHKHVDFLQEINPPGGGKEATGIVTRFTTASTGHESEVAPIKLKIFNQSDLCKVILNGYLSDISKNTYKVDREEVQLLINKQYEKIREQSEKQAGFDEYDVLGLEKYLNKHFSNHIIVKELNDLGFWEDLRKIVPCTHFSQRYQLLELIWGKHDFFSELFNNASKSIAKLGFRSEIRCRLDAISPSSDTIIDVERLREFYNSDSKAAVDIFDGESQLCKLERSPLSLITAEVSLCLPTETAEAPSRGFLKQADVLDFPGARSRNKILEDTFSSNDNVEKLEVFLRGKVAYLFDLYNEKFGLSTLLYCMDDTQQEVQDIPHLIYSWLSRVHGSTAEQRQERELKLQKHFNSSQSYNPLLVVQTKFNMDLQGNPSLERLNDSSTHDWKWDSRLEANFREFMMRPLTDKWINNWTPHDSFRNVFFLRDPKWSTTIFETEEGLEKGINKAYKQRLIDMKTSFTGHKQSHNLFHDKEETWNAAATIGNSGVNQIVEYLTPTSDPYLKLIQIHDQLAALNKDIDRELRKFYVDNDFDKEVQKARKKSLSVISLISAHRDKKIFGSMLDAMVLKDNIAWKIAYDLLIKGKHSGNNKMKGPISINLIATLKNMGMSIHEDDEVNKVLETLKEFFGITDIDDLVEGCKQVGINIDSLLEFLSNDSGERSPSEIFAEDLMAFWFDRLQNLTEDENGQKWAMNRYTLELIIDEIMLTAERVTLKERVQQAISPWVDDFLQKDDLKVIARIATHIINKFIGTLGWSEVTLENRPKNELNQHIFDLGSGAYPDKSTLTLKLNTTNEHIFVDWCTGFKETFTANVNFRHGLSQQVDSRANQRLGAILKRLESTV